VLAPLPAAAPAFELPDALMPPTPLALLDIALLTPSAVVVPDPPLPLEALWPPVPALAVAVRSPASEAPASASIATLLCSGSLVQLLRTKSATVPRTGSDGFMNLTFAPASAELSRSASSCNAPHPLVRSGSDTNVISPTLGAVLTFSIGRYGES
jgi:hypothetical protein